MTASADAPVSTYRQAVEDTITIVSGARAGDVDAAHRALLALEAGTGHTQPEIIADLTLRPPDFVDAGARLQQLDNALAAPVTTVDPASAQQQLKGVLSMHRYDGLHQPPTLLDRLTQWIRDRLNDLLNFLFGHGAAGGQGIPAAYFYILGVIAVAVAAVVIFRSTRGRLSESVADRMIGPRAPADFFAEADRLATAGDRVGAIRSLCAGVAATLAGEQSWQGSPLTVREIFSRAGDPAQLHPLLLPFEAAIYGGRDVDEATYKKAELAAEPFRKPPTREAAA
ncbi:MAG TPA: hypothetical protein VLR46_01750 [Candidatus Dormibacteraeota bacterium]|nr:hypothetical protein [Candidatus Dormibacteraeota bacterium]